MIINQKQKGFSLIELVVYIAGMLALLSVLTLLTVQFYGLYKEMVAVPRADRTGIMLVDVITKEIRSASAIDVFNSQFGITDGVLSLIVNEEGVEVEKMFYVEDGRVYIDIEGDIESLSSSDFTVSNFNFAFVSTGVSQAVRFTLELQFEARDDIETKNYTGFAILRESYE